MVIELGDVNLLADNFSLVLVMIPWEFKTFHARFPVATLGLSDGDVSTEASHHTRERPLMPRVWSNGVHGERH